MSIFDGLRKAETVQAPQRRTRKRKYITDSRHKIREYVLEVVNKGGVLQSDELVRAGYARPTVQRVLADMAKAGEVSCDSRKKPYSYTKASTTPVPKKPQAKRAYKPSEESMEQILDFVTKNEGKRYSFGQMAEVLDIPRGSIYQLVYKLQKQNLLGKDFNLGNEIYREEKEEVVEATPVAEKAKAPVSDHSSIEFLIWQFIKETRSVDLLQFLEWLDKR